MPNRTERRRSQRAPCSKLVTVVQDVGAREHNSYVAIVEDVSDRGACLSMDGPLESETLIGLQSNAGTAPAAIRYRTYRPQEETYAIGVEFVGDFDAGKAFGPE